MIEQSTIQFLANLKNNNNKEWFDANKKSYELAKANFLDFVSFTLNQLKKIDNTLIDLEPKKCVFRINRDIRFSKDKSPYKTNFGMSFSKGGKKIMTAGYYFHLEPKSCFIGGGIYMPMAENIKKIRQEIDYNFNDFKKIINQKKFKELFGSLDFSKEFTLQRAPKGYEENNEAINYLKLKSWIVSCGISEKDVVDKLLPKKVIDTFSTLKPLVDFLNQAIEQ